MKYTEIIKLLSGLLFLLIAGIGLIFGGELGGIGYLIYSPFLVIVPFFIGIFIIITVNINGYNKTKIIESFKLTKNSNRGYYGGRYLLCLIVIILVLVSLIFSE